MPSVRVRVISWGYLVVPLAGGYPVLSGYPGAFLGALGITLGDLAQRTTAKAPAFPAPESNQRKNPNPPRVLLGGPWRGEAEDSNSLATTTVTYHETSVSIVEHIVS